MDLEVALQVLRKATDTPKHPLERLTWSPAPPDPTTSTMAVGVLRDRDPPGHSAAMVSIRQHERAGRHAALRSDHGVKRCTSEP